jgi:hypothetical protein
MGENASASFEDVITEEVGTFTVKGSGGEVKVGYFTDVSWRKISISRGEDFILMPWRKIGVSVKNGQAGVNEVNLLLGFVEAQQLLAKVS